MGEQHGDFVWYELMTADADAAQAFYAALIGWDFADGPHDHIDYRTFTARGARRSAVCWR